MKRKDIKEEIRKYFFINPTARLRVRQIERELKLSLPSVIQYCKELEKESILKKEKVAGAILFSAHRTSKHFLIEKKFYNIKSLYESGFIEHIIMELSNPIIILFGSYARGEDIENSDIDLYVQTPSKKNMAVEKFEEVLKRKIQIFHHRTIKDVSNSHLKNNIINGVILNGFLEVFI